MGIVNNFIDKIADKVTSNVTKTVFGLKTPYLTNIWEQNEETSKLTRPYEQLSAVYASIRAKAMNLAQVPFRVYQIGKEEPEEKGELVDLFNYVNRNMSRFQLWEAIVTLLDIHGEGPVYKDFSEVRGRKIPGALIPVNPKNMTPRYMNSIHVGWTVKLGNKTIETENDEWIFCKYFNPNDQLRGLAPISAAKLSLESEWGAVKYNEVFFKQGQAPGSVFTTEQKLSDQQYGRLQNELIGKNKGVDNAHRSLLLDGGLKLDNVRPSNRDMEYLEMRKFNREEIAMIFKVPKAELSLYEDINYATAQSSDLSFWKKTLIPLMRLIEDKFNTEFLQKLGYEGRFDIKAVDVLNHEVIEKAEAATQFFKLGIPANMINERLGLGFPDIPGGDEPPVPRVSTQQNSVKQLRVAGDSELPTVETPEVDKAVLEKKWKSLMDPILPEMGKASRRVKEYFYDVQQKILKRVIKNYGDPDNAVVEKAEADEQYEDIGILFSDQDLKEAIYVSVVEATNQGATSLGDIPVPARQIRQAVQERAVKVVGINETAKNLVIDRLRKARKHIIEEGLTETQAAEYIVDQVKESMNINMKKARTIARTEVHGAYNDGRQAAAETAGFQYKRWIATPDNRTRDTHAHLNGKIVGFEDDFLSGLGFPHDQRAPAGEVINCRCVLDYLDEEDRL